MLQGTMKRKAIYTSEDAHELTSAGKDWNFHHVNTRQHLHSLHPYPAKFIPQIPHKAITMWSKEGDLVYDPFGGCGTTLLEASLLGRPSIGTDNNPVAVLVSQAKVAIYSKRALEDLKTFADTFDAQLRNARAHPAPESDRLTFWFSAPVFKRLAAIKGVILQSPKSIQTLLMAIFSSIIVKVSYQDSDTRYARVPRHLTPEDVDRAFKSKLDDIVRSLPEVIVPGREKARVVLSDARKVPFIDSGTVSLIVTSPPYLNAYDYHKYHRQRIHWIDGDVAFARDLEIGSHDEFTKPRATPDQYFVDMQLCFDEWRRVLKRGGRCLVVIGDAIVSKRPVPVADTYVELAKKSGLRLEDRWIRELQATKRAFNVRNSRITHEHVLLFKKP